MSKSIPSSSSGAKTSLSRSRADRGIRRRGHRRAGRILISCEPRTAARRAAEARERQEQREGGPAADAAIAGALALTALAGRLHGWPPPEDPVSRREDLEGYRRWARLRAALGRDGRAG